MQIAKGFKQGMPAFPARSQPVSSSAASVDGSSRSADRRIIVAPPEQLTGTILRPRARGDTAL
jgi:hypothetical protein